MYYEFYLKVRPSHLKKPGGPKMGRPALSSRAMRGQPQEALCRAYFCRTTVYM